jgi:hypothetical protein
MSEREYECWLADERKVNDELTRENAKLRANEKRLKAHTRKLEEALWAMVHEHPRSQTPGQREALVRAQRLLSAAPAQAGEEAKA